MRGNRMSREIAQKLLRLVDVVEQQAAGGGDVALRVQAHHGMDAAFLNGLAYGLPEPDVAIAAFRGIHGGGELLAQGKVHHLSLDDGEDAVVGDGVDGLLLQTALIQQGAGGKNAGKK